MPKNTSWKRNSNHRTRDGSTASHAAFLFAGLLIGGALFYAGHAFWPQQTVQSSLSSSKSTPVPKRVFTGVLGESTIADIAENAEKMTVNIDTRASVLVEQQFMGLPLAPTQRELRGAGSGFIIRSDGYILTNNHVVENADEIRVTLGNGKKPLRAKLVGRDPKNDLALVKVNATNLPVATLGDSSTLRPGDWVIAIGSPLGLQQSVTLGIVSAVNRSFNDVAQQFIQTDAAINPGNSGGPLLNIHGEVIGVNVAIIQNGQNLGFAIPVTVAKTVATQLLETGKIAHPYLGISVEDATPEIADQLGMDLNTQGTLIVQVERRGPADRGGLQPFDLIVELNGRPIKTSVDFQKALQACKPGQSVKVAFIRAGEQAETQLTVGSLPQSAR